MSDLSELYKQNPAELNIYCRDNWKTYFDGKFKDKVKENLELYNNYSQILADRQADPDGPVRACLFIPVINTAVLGRAGWMRQITFNVPEPIAVESEDEEDQQSVKNAPDVKLLVNSYLTTEEFKTLYLQKLLIQELYPIGFYFISEFEEEKKILNIIPDMEEIAPQYKVDLGFKKEWGAKKKQWRPKVDIYSPESIAYDPYAIRWDRESVTFVMKILHLTLGELKERQKPPFSYKFEVEDLKINGEKAVAADRKIKTDDETSAKISEITSRYVVLENWVRIEDKEGNMQTRIIVSCGKVNLKDRAFPYETLDITDIFIPFIGYPIVNQLEGVSTADLLKYLQHAINDAFNMEYDATSYGNFPPNLKDTRAKIVSEGRMGPSSIKDVDMRGMPEGMTVAQVFHQLYQPNPTGPEKLAIINLLFELCDMVGGVPQDIISRVTGSPQETATKTNYRAQAASSRLSGIHLLSHVEEFRKLCNTLYFMTLERLQIGEDLKIGKKKLVLDNLLGEFKFDMPYLSGLLDRQEKEREFTEFMILTKDEALMSLPQVRYKLIKKLAQFKGIDDFDKIVPPELIEPIQPATGGMAQQQLTPQSAEVM